MRKFSRFLFVVLILSMVFSLTGCGSKAKTEVLRYDTTPVALIELANGGVDAVVADSPVVLEYIKENPDSGLVAFGDDTFEKEFYGIAMRQDDTELHELVNEGLRKVKESGEYDKIFNKYFGDGADYQVPESANTLNLTFNVASDMAYAPFEYIDEATNEPVGFDMDLIRAIAKESGFAVNLVNTNWDGIIPALLAGNADMIISAMTITEERQKSVTFSDPYFEATQYIAVKEGSPIKSLADLEGKKIGVQNATTGDIAVTKYFNLD